MNLRKKKYHLTSVLFIMLLLLSGSMIVWAWSSLENRSFGASYGTVDEAYTQEVWLEKMEKDIDGEETDIPIESAEFYLYDKDSVERLSGPYLTDEDGKIVLNSPPGEYCFKETHLPPNYTYDIDDDLNPRISYCFTVDEVDDEAENEDEKETIVVIAYNRRLSGPLTISKIVDEYLEYYDADHKFEFTVTFSDNRTYDYRIDDGPEQTLTSGETLFLKDGERAIFERLPVGITYLLVETPVPGYTIASDNHQGIITEEGNEVIFVNTAKPPSLIVKKEVRGDEIDPDEVFEFVSIIGDEEIPFEQKNGESKIYVDLPVGAPYEVWEIDPIDYGYIASPEQFTGVVLNHTITLPFINYIKTESDEMGELQIGKIVVGEEIDPDQRFTFEVTIGNLPDDLETITVDGEPMDVTPADHTFEVSLAHEETILIEGLPPRVIYTVEELPTPGYTSGIVSQTGTIVADRAVEAWFINERHEIEESTTLRIRKVVEGDVPETEEDVVFDFTLEIDGEIYKRFTLEDGEEIIFTDLPIGGTYLVQEVDIPVLVSVENGTWTLSEEEIVVTFTNQYSRRNMIELDGTKTWELNEYEVDLPEFIIVHLKHDDVILQQLELHQMKTMNGYTALLCQSMMKMVMRLNILLKKFPLMGAYQKLKIWL